MFKLIRDNIPEIMKEQNKVCNYAAVGNDELYEALLRDKLVEEVNEFLRSGDFEELVDVQTVIDAIIAFSTDRELFNKAYEAKLETKGGFSKRIIGFFPDKPVEKEDK